MLNPGDLLNTKMPSYQYRDSHYKDKTVSRPSYLYDGNPLHGKTVLTLKRRPDELINVWWEHSVKNIFQFSIILWLFYIADHSMTQTMYLHYLHIIITINKTTVRVM